MERKREATTLAVHRCRFVDYAPSAITALAFPPLPLPSVKGKKKSTFGKQRLKYGTLAVGHANGNIDLSEWMGGEHDVQSSQAWVIRKTLAGPYPSKVDSLAFVIRYPDDFTGDDVPTCKDLRLFSSGGGSELLEWDLERSCIRRTISSQGGAIWSIAANPASNTLALGCEDGTVRLISLLNDTLTHSRKFDRVKCRMLSIAWGPPIPRQSQATAKTKKSIDDSSDDDDDEDEWEDLWLVTGGSDSSLRKWDVKTGRVIDRMGTDRIRGERTLVWAVGVLGDGTIVSGDSLGMVKFWDSRTCTLLQNFPAHGADVLCLTISPEGKAVYTSGVDQKTIQFSLIKTSSTEKGSSSLGPSTRWGQTASRRMHSHDVRALTTWPPYAPLPVSFQRTFQIDIAPVVVSGGLDMNVVVAPAALPTSTVVKVTNPLNTSTEATFEDAYHRRLAYPVTGAVKVSRTGRLVICVREAGLTVWSIHRKPMNKGTSEEEAGDVDMEGNVEDSKAQNELDEEPFTGGWEKVLEMNLTVSTNIVASEISDDGSWLVVSDLYETKLFSLRTDAQDQITPRRIRDFTSILSPHIPSTGVYPSTGGLAFAFTPDSSKLVMSTTLSAYVLVIDLTNDVPRVLRRFDHHRRHDAVLHNRVIVNGRKPSTQKPQDVDMADANADADPGAASDASSSSSSSSSATSATPSTPVTIPHLAISPDGQWLSTSDSAARTHIFNLDSIAHHTTLPSFPRPACALAFTPGRTNVLILALPDNTVHVYDVEARTFPAWGRALATSLPKRFTHAHDPVLGVVFDPAPKKGRGEDGEYALFWGATWMFKVALGTSVRVQSGGGKKRRRDGKEREGDGQSLVNGHAPLVNGSVALVNGVDAHSGDAFVGEDDRPWRDYKMITQYRPLLGVAYLGAGELVVIERPLVDVLAGLPPAYWKHKYGAT